jgi:hypothetical protein
MNTLKKDFLELLDKDVEFRYTVAGYIGILEVLKRLDGLAEEQIRLREGQTKIWDELKAIREEQNSLREEQIRLREDFNKMFYALNLRINRVERTLEKLTVDVEDEARSIVRHRLKELGIDVKLDPLILPGLELNVYGVSDEVCVVGEATVRGGAKIVDELLGKIEVLRTLYPDKLRGKVIPVVYACLPLPDLVEEAAKKGIWLLKATQDFYKPSF